MSLALGVALAGVAGAIARYVVDGAVQDRTEGTFPYGTFVVNVVGSTVLGVVTGLAWYHGLDRSSRVVLGIGFCGAFTTWSTVAWETLRLAEDGVTRQAVVSMAGGVAVCLAAAGAALALTAAA
ncbi:MAG TPA: fluoride efflux transporter CrcB [Acidimicrobiales bacterium]|nr:fluoride efflux transporter CrcB [Acidimicrobiales bacterium]